MTEFAITTTSRSRCTGGPPFSITAPWPTSHPAAIATFPTTIAVGATDAPASSCGIAPFACAELGLALVRRYRLLRTVLGGEVAVP
jgi:hypothetical protein